MFDWRFDKAFLAIALGVACLENWLFYDDETRDGAIV